MSRSNTATAARSAALQARLMEICAESEHNGWRAALRTAADRLRLEVAATLWLLTGVAS